MILEGTNFAGALRALRDSGCTGVLDEVLYYVADIHRVITNAEEGERRDSADSATAFRVTNDLRVEFFAGPDGAKGGLILEESKLRGVR